MLEAGVRLATHCVPPAGELRSDICGESDHEACVSFGTHATPASALLGTVRRGWIPKRAIASLGPICLAALRPGQSDRASFVGSAQRVTNTRRSCEAAAGWYPLPTPSGCAEKRRSWGGRVCRRTHTLRRLARRCCLSGVRRTKRVHRRPPQIRASQVARSEAKGRRQRGRLLFGDFLLAAQEKVTAPPGAHPGLRPQHRPAAIIDNRPPR
jgi:hypothetical protein